MFHLLLKRKTAPRMPDSQPPKKRGNGAGEPGVTQRVVNALIHIFAPKHRAIGIDGSHWWGTFNPALATKPIDFIILKATEGTGFRDSALHANYQGAAAIPVRGMYHFQRAGMSWIKQAEFFLKVIEPYDIHVLALDVEKIGNEVAFNDRAEADTFFGDMRRIIDYWRFKTNGKTILLYTNPDIYFNHIAPAIKRLYGQGGTDWLEAVPKWIAVYNGQNEDGNPTSKWGIPPWMFWQFSSNGRKEDYGTQGDVDQNVYNGTVEELHRRILGQEVPTQPPPAPPVDPPPVVLPVEPQTLPETWAGRIVSIPTSRIRIYPEVTPDTDTGLRLIYSERISGKLWEGNGYLWMKLDDTNKESVRGKWIAVRKPGGDTFARLDPQPKPPATDPRFPQLWRVKHDIEIGTLWRPNMPEVHPLFPNHHSEFGRGWQLLSKAMNPKINGSRWTACYTFQRYVTNNQGFGNPNDPRANYVLGTNLKEETPRVEALTTGGSFHTGTVEGNVLIVETLDASAVPSLDWIMARPWFWVYAVTVDSKGTPRRFPQGLQANGEIVPIIHPLVTNRSRHPKITIPLSKLEKWDMTKPLPDPFKIYLK